MNAPKVSILVPIYNVSQYIERSARSLFGQTMEDLEYIFVDDCSPDNSVEILKQVLEEYPLRKGQVKILHHEKNSGTPQARKDAIHAAQGEYILHVDSDDYLDVNMVEKLYAKALEDDADIVACDFFVKSEDSQRRIIVAPDGIGENGMKFRDDTLNRVGWPNVWFRLTKRSLYAFVEGYWPKSNNSEDTVITIITTFFAKKISYVDEPLYYYWQNINSVTHAHTAKVEISNQLDRRHNIWIIEKFLKANQAEKQYFKGIVTEKSYCRNQLLTYSKDLRCWWLWMTMFPGLNWLLFWGNRQVKSTYREKLWFLSIASGLYPKLKKKLLHKKYRPALIWRAGIRQESLT